MRLSKTLIMNTVIGFGKSGIMNNELWIINNQQELVGISRRTNSE